MQVIPVIDIRGGVVVAASRGDRARYRPLETPLAASSDPVTVALALHALFPFPTLYVADLDGIEGGGADIAAQRDLANAWPGSELWIDDGEAAPLLSSPKGGEERRGSRLSQDTPSPLRGGMGWGEPRDPLMKSQPLGHTITNHVLGSESLTSLADYNSARERVGPSAPLSLDFRGDTFVGPPQLLDDATLWPDRVIVMTLARVGSGEGPDLVRLASIVARAGDRQIFAAGGVRDIDDLRSLRDIGVEGALVATALHSGKITSADIAALV